MPSQTSFEWPEEATLTPYSGVQTLAFGFNIDLVGRGAAAFCERLEERSDGEEVWRFWPVSGDEARDRRIPAARDEREADYSISKLRALEPFLRKWTPVPLLRVGHGRGEGGAELYDPGPSTWARLQIVELDDRDPETGDTHRVLLAIDTDLAAEAAEADDEPYLMPSRADAADEREFRLVSDPEQMDWFLRCPVTDEDGTEFDQQKWVDEWLDGQFRDFKQAQRPGRALKPEDFPYRFEHWARYLAMLRLVCEAVTPPRLTLIDTVSADTRRQAVEVDMILDIGNSRSCGILIENYPDETRVDLNNCYALSLRDLGRPELVRREPFESRVEFAQADFGPENIARRSGRARPAFLWPSLVRVGPEALRLVRAAEGTETTSGLSSPKRYIWDEKPVTQDWRFHGVGARQTLPLAARAACRFLNSAGDDIAQIEDEARARLRDRLTEADKTSATRPRFSRSALYGFMLSELIAHALVQINDPGGRLTRKRSELPRRLRNIILTLPSATPLQEQAIMRSRAEGAVRLVWELLGWSGTESTTTARPRVVVDWDEASCTQLVWLYDEIAQKFGGQIESYFTLRGRPRRRPAELGGGKPEPSLRVGCIDIGGGTTDLMISTYYSEDNRAIRLIQNVREGFRIAGDDVAQEVVSRILLPQLREQLDVAGAEGAESLLRELFSANVGDVQEQLRQRRRQFALQVLTPLAYAALGLCEEMAPGESRGLAVSDAVGAKPRADDTDSDEPAPLELDIAEDVVAYLERPARQRGAADWRLAEARFEISANAVDQVVRDVMGPALEAMLELVAHLDVDAVLLSGRPTRLPTIANLVREAMATAPHRVIPMHLYKVGNWYPYRDRVRSRIGDPKTTAAVGAMLCQLASSWIVNFKLHTDEIRMRSTARFIGQMESNGQIFRDRVLFSDVDLQKPGATEEIATVFLRSPMHIGFRQLEHERWIGAPLYRLDFANESARNLPGPLKVELKRREFDGDADSASEKLRAEAVKEAFEVESVEDSEGATQPRRVVRLSLHTLGAETHEYWLDSGVFRLG